MSCHWLNDHAALAAKGATCRLKRSRFCRGVLEGVLEGVVEGVVEEEVLVAYILLITVLLSYSTGSTDKKAPVGT